MLKDKPLTKPALEMSQVSMRFGPITVLDSVDFDVNPGEIHALVGHNGAGKSTLMKIALGGYPPTSGQVLIGGMALSAAQPSEARALGVGMVLQERSLIETLDGLDNLFLNVESTSRLHVIRRKDEEVEARELLRRLGISPQILRTPVARMSAVERQMLEIAKAMRLAATLLILDEPTAPLSHGEIEALFEVIRTATSTGIGVVLITHHLGEIFKVSDRVTVLRGGQVSLAVPTSETNLDRVVLAMLGRQHVAPYVSSTDRGPFQAEPVLRLSELDVRGKLHGVSFEVFAGEIVGIAGLAGSGRTTLLKALFGDFRPTSGSIRVGARNFAPRHPREAIDRGLFLIPEDRHDSGLVEMHSIAENVVLPILRRMRRWLTLRMSAARSLTRKLGSRLHLMASSVDQRVEELSGGNQQKVVLAKALATKPSLLLLDEPTFGVDIGAAAEVIRQVRRLADDGAAIIWSTSDLQELIEVSDRIVVLADGVVRAVIDAR